MKKNFKIVQFVTWSFMICALCFSTAFADKHKKKKYERESFSPITNETYKQECSACHFNYQPGLLPAASWKKILATGIMIAAVIFFAMSLTLEVLSRYHAETKRLTYLRDPVLPSPVGQGNG